MNALLGLEKLVYIFLLISIGAGADRLGILNLGSRRDLSRLMIDFFWPALIFSSITGKLTPGDILSGWILPLLGIITSLTGLLLGALLRRAGGVKENEKGIFYYHCLVNNFVFLVLPFLGTFVPGKGSALLFIHNIGMTVVIWTAGVGVIGKNYSFKTAFKQLINPGTLATIAAVLVVFTGTGKYIPSVVNEVISALGAPASIVALLVTGSQINEMGARALCFNRQNLVLGVLRLILVPGLLFPLALLLKSLGWLSRDALWIFMLVNLMPVSLNSVSMAIRYEADSALAAQGVVFTHFFAIFTIPVFLFFMEKFL